MYENYAIVLEYLPNGYPQDTKIKRSPITQILGENYFALLEAVPKKEVLIHERVYIGKGDREKISHIKKRLEYDELTSTAKVELPYVVEDIVSKDEDRFVKFFNESMPISIRSHQLELLSGVGKKLMNDILEERRRKKFSSFEDIKQRIPTIPDPKKMIVKRIISEIKKEDRYRIFVK